MFGTAFCFLFSVFNLQLILEIADCTVLSCSAVCVMFEDKLSFFGKTTGIMNSKFPSSLRRRQLKEICKAVSFGIFSLFLVAFDKIKTQHWIFTTLNLSCLQ